MVQQFINKRGASFEKSQPIAYLEVETEEGIGNIAYCYAKDGTHIASIAHRPWNEALKQDNYLFLT